MDKIHTRRLLTIRQFSETHGWPQGGLRHLVFYKPKGFKDVIRKVGRKVMLDEERFFK